MGALFAFIVAIFSSAKDLVSKRVSQDMDPGVSTLASFAYALPLYLIILPALHYLGFESFKIGSSFFLFVLLRSTTDIGAEWFKIKAISTGDVSLVTLFIAFRPVFLIFISPLITGDQVSTLSAAAVLLTGAGCVLMVWKGGLISFSDRRAIAFALISAFCFCFNDCFDRLAVQQASAVMSAFMMTLLSAIFVLGILMVRRVRLAPMVIGAKLLTLRGLFEVLSMTCKMLALQYLTAPAVATIVRLNLVFSVLGGGLVFKERDTVRRLLAALMIIIGSAIVAWEG